MIYQIISPFAYTINAETYKEAIKNFINFNREMNINKIIITDQTNHMEARLNYYKYDGRNKVGINMFPINYGMPPPLVVNDTYIPPMNFYPPMSPINSFIPTVINMAV
jgi:hypothetical protein